MPVFTKFRQYEYVFIHADVKIIKVIYFVCIINISLARFQRHIETAEY